MEQSSANGRWKRGMVYSPETGKHAGHKVEIINPQFPAHGFVPVLGDDGGIVPHSVQMTLVFVRCQTDLLSWMFEETESVPA